jgi:hypothetical protein
MEAVYYVFLAANTGYAQYFTMAVSLLFTFFTFADYDDEGFYGFFWSNLTDEYRIDAPSVSVFMGILSAMICYEGAGQAGVEPQWLAAATAFITPYVVFGLIALLTKAVSNLRTPHYYQT